MQRIKFMPVKKNLTPEDLPDPLIQAKLLQNKKFPEKYRLQILLALLPFPELINVRIRFEERKQWFPLASRPNWKRMFLPKNQWEYLILFSTKSTYFSESLLFSQIPFNAQIGILGHELCHTIYFLDKKMMGVFSTGLKYLFSDYRIKFEKETDREAIHRGLGWQLLEFANYCRKHSNHRINKWLDNYYLPPSEIEKFIYSLQNNNGTNQQKETGF